MATGTLAPNPWFTGLDTNGNPLAGGKLYTYIAGTTTLATTYTDVALSVANANPIILDAAGRCVIYLAPGASYKFILQDSTGASIKTQDNISAVPAVTVNLDVTGTAGEALTAGQAVYLSDGSGSKTAGSWYKADSANGYSSVTPVVGMVPASIASLGSGTIRLAGQVTGLSGLTVGTTYFVSTGGATTSTAPANRRYLGVADSTSSLVLMADPLTVSTVIASTTTSNQNNWAPGLAIDTVIFWSGAGDITVTGFAGGVTGQRVTFRNTGTNVATFSHNSGSSSAGNKFKNIATSAGTPVAANGHATWQYDGTDWQLVDHDQGAWITPAYAAGTFTTNGAGGWTVASGDVTVCRYKISGRSISWELGLATTSVVAATGTELIVGSVAWGSFSITTGFIGNAMVGDNSATLSGGVGYVLAGTTMGGSATQIWFIKNGVANWTASADLTYLYTNHTFEVT